MFRNGGGEEKGGDENTMIRKEGDLNLLSILTAQHSSPCDLIDHKLGGVSSSTSLQPFLEDRCLVVTRSPVAPYLESVASLSLIIPSC